MKSNKTGLSEDIFYFSTLVLVFIILCLVFVGHQGHLLIDCGRSVYIPELILKNKVLYKDIFVLYGPLSYQINAILYKILGMHLNTLYLAGIANSFVILATYYLISRKLTSTRVSWLAGFLLMTVGFFYYFIPNYIFPYSYSIIYALSAFLISVLLCLNYIEKSNPFFLIFSGLFMGISVSSKVDFSLFYFVLLAIAVYFKPLQFKDFTFFLLASALVPLISWGALFIQGLSPQNLFNYLQTMREFLSSESLSYFYSHHTGLYPSPLILHGLKKVSLDFLYNFSIVFGVFFLFFWLFNKIPGSKFKTALQVIVFILLYIVFPKDFFKDMASSVSLGWLGASTAVILLFSLKDKIVVLVSIAGVLAAMKSFFLINLNVFGTFLIPLLLLVNLVFVFDKLPKSIKFISEKPWRQTLFAVLFILGIVFLLKNLNYVTNWHIHPIETDRGRIFTANKWGESINQLINFINQEIPPEKKFIVMPEGQMINFLTGRESPSWFHAYTPHFVEKFDERIITDIKQNQPDYIFITNQETDDYYYSYFCGDYGKNICEYVRKKYKYKGRIESPGRGDDFLWIDIYKIK